MTEALEVDPNGASVGTVILAVMCDGQRFPPLSVVVPAVEHLLGRRGPKCLALSKRFDESRVKFC